MDLWRLENLHLIVMAAAFRKLYQAELYLLSALFRLFRGKKRNILRHRTDSMEYDSMQLLVGTIGFCICVFLWTTILVYYTFFVVWNFVMHLPIVGLWITYILSRSIPWGSLLYRFLHPDWFPKDVYMDFTAADAMDVQISSLESIPESPIRILLNHIAVPLSRILKWCLRSFLEVLYPHSENSCPISLPVASLLMDLKVLGETSQTSLALARENTKTSSEKHKRD